MVEIDGGDDASPLPNSLMKQNTMSSGIVGQPVDILTLSLSPRNNTTFKVPHELKQEKSKEIWSLLIRSILQCRHLKNFSQRRQETQQMGPVNKLCCPVPVFYYLWPWIYGCPDHGSRLRVCHSGSGFHIAGIPR